VTARGKVFYPLNKRSSHLIIISTRLVILWSTTLQHPVRDVLVRSCSCNCEHALQPAWVSKGPQSISRVQSNYILYIIIKRAKKTFSKIIHYIFAHSVLAKSFERKHCNNHSLSHTGVALTSGKQSLMPLQLYPTVRGTYHPLGRRSCSVNHFFRHSKHRELAVIARYVCDRLGIDWY